MSAATCHAVNDSEIAQIAPKVFGPAGSNPSGTAAGVVCRCCSAKGLQLR